MKDILKECERCNPVINYKDYFIAYLEMIIDTNVLSTRHTEILGDLEKPDEAKNDERINWCILSQKIADLKMNLDQNINVCCLDMQNKFINDLQTLIFN